GGGSCRVPVFSSPPPAARGPVRTGDAMTVTTRRPIARFAGALALGIGAMAIAVTLDAPVVSTLFAQGCGLRYVATGDDIAAGHHVTSDERYGGRRLADHLRKWGAWCEYDLDQDKTTAARENTTQLART